ncbi:hypothetical protein GOV09_00070 [Candidatus Woesearchaeota archaeon]|nr:hypothetical protein [Candidatus Woesearchaeota archaeon]
MKIQTAKKELELVVATDKFLISETVNDTRNVGGEREDYQRQIEAMVMITAHFKLTERESYQDEYFGGSKEWYVVYVNYFDHLNADGRFDRLQARSAPIGSWTKLDSKRRYDDELESCVRQEFPGHNVSLKVEIHSKLFEQTRHSAELLQVLKPYIGQVIDEGITKSKQHIRGMAT